jgi:5,10-methylene-tetrahydrofolate dehydrogenase/methenyl tetrahydrofolate cyclohydrolase
VQDSETYVRNKKKACAECGMESFGTDLPEDATEQQVRAQAVHVWELIR